MASDFNPEEFSKFKAGAKLDESTDYNPQEFEGFKSAVPSPLEDTTLAGRDARYAILNGAVTDATKDLLSPLIGNAASFNKPPTSGNPSAFGAAVEKLAQPFQGIAGPSRLSALFSQPAQIAGQASADLMQNKGVNPTVAKIAGTGLSIALDPQTYAGSLFGDAALSAGKSLATKAGEEAATAASAMSGVKVRDIVKLFQNPIEVITALSSKVAGGLFGAAKKAAGVTREEEFLISKAADRALGGARSVAEDLRPVFEATPEALSTGQLLALRRAATKLAMDAKGSEKALWAPVADATTDIIKKRSEALLSALKEVANAKTKEAFLRLVPRSVTGKPDFFRTAGLAAGLVTSPAVAGLGTLAAKVASQAVKTVANPVVARTAAGVGSTFLRNYPRQ